MSDQQSHHILDQAEAGLKTALEKLLGGESGAGDPPRDPPEKLARGVSAILKALDDITARRDALTQKAEAAKYTRFEDLPPPTPEDRARFHDRFLRLYAEITEPHTTDELQR